MSRSAGHARPALCLQAAAHRLPSDRGRTGPARSYPTTYRIHVVSNPFFRPLNQVFQGVLDSARSLTAARYGVRRVADLPDMWKRQRGKPGTGAQATAGRPPLWVCVGGRPPAVTRSRSCPTRPASPSPRRRRWPGLPPESRAVTVIVAVPVPVPPPSAWSRPPTWTPRRSWTIRR